MIVLLDVNMLCDLCPLGALFKIRVLVHTPPDGREVSLLSIDGTLLMT